MNALPNISFTLCNSLAAISAIYTSDRIPATDGKNAKIYFFDSSGGFTGQTCTSRPYRRLRSADGLTYTALSCSAAARLYCTDGNFNEKGYIPLEAAADRGENCALQGCPTDASTTVIGGEAFIVASFPKKAYLFDMQGKRLLELCAAEGGETITDFISFGSEKYAFATLDGNRQTVTVSDGRSKSSLVLSGRFSLRMLFAQGETVYGLFGERYLYNRILPIYSEGRLSLPPTGIENSRFSC
jgi:hypothetical protein